MIRGLVSGIFMAGMLLLFGVVMLSALLPVLRPGAEAVSRADQALQPDRAPEPDRASDTASAGAESAPADAAASPSTSVAKAEVDSAAAADGTAAEDAGTDAAASSKTRGKERPASDRPRRIASLPPVPGAGVPPASPPDARTTRPDVPDGARAVRLVPDPLSGQAAVDPAARDGKAASLPGTREAARPPAPRRDAELPARPAPRDPAPAPAEDTGQDATTQAATEMTPSHTASDAGTGAVTTGLPVPERDTAPGARIRTVPAIRPETGGRVADIAQPRADVGPPAPAVSPRDTVAPGRAVPPPAIPRAPETDLALAAPGLPGRTLQSTPIQPGTAPEIGDTAPRIGRVDTGPRAGPGFATPLPGAGAATALPEVGAPTTGNAQGASEPEAAPETPGTAVEVAPDAGGATVTEASPPITAPTTAPGAAPRAALPRVRRPGADNGQETDSPAFDQSGFGRPGTDAPAFGGPSAPAVEERALPVPGFSGLRSGVHTGRLPQIGDDGPGTADDGEPPIDAAPGPDADAGAAVPDPDRPVAYNAESFANPDGRPVFAVILLDDATGAAGHARLANLDLPLTVALDPTAPDAAGAAERYRAAGKEVLILASALPPNARAVDVEVSLAGMFASVPAALGLIDMAEGGFQNDRITARHVVEVLGAEGYGLLTYDRGLNAAAQLAEQADLAVGRVFRVLDAEGEDEETIRRYLDRAAFRAAQQGTVIVMGHNRPETVAALIGWAMEGRARSVALAPVSAALTR